MSTFSADVQIDCLGLYCPMPIVKTRDAIARMLVGQTLEMLSDDPASEADMSAWAAGAGQELLEIDKDGAVYRFVVRKTR